MKFILSLLLIFQLNLVSDSQILHPVKWNSTKVKIDNRTYKIILNASIQRGWHLYAQTQPNTAVVEPLKIVFSKNNMVQLSGKPLEIGKMAKVFDKSIGIGAYQYSDNLQVVQLIKLKSAAKTTLKGTITFQVCNAEKCLPAQDEEFSVSIL